MSITGYIPYACVHYHYSAKTNKPHNFITERILQNGPQKEKIITRPKEICQSRDPHFDQHINNHSSKTQHKQVIQLAQSTELGPVTTQTISRQKGTFRSRQVHFYNHIDRNITKTFNLIPIINQNRLKTIQTISQPEVPVKIVGFLSQA